ncbi:MAG: alpha/beta hydrolase [Acidimicrobiia bacterium]
MAVASPTLTVHRADGETRAVVLLCYGGKSESRNRSRPWHLSALRLVPFARTLRRGGASEGVAVWTLRYRLRGWNGEEASPVADARWALAQIERRHGPVPVVLVGHSMGGRVALRVADHPLVRGVIALAPWVGDAEPVAHLACGRVLIMHGTADRWTSSDGSFRYACRLAETGAEVHRCELPRLGHFMLRRAGLWHGLTAVTALRWLADALGGQSKSPPGTNTPEMEVIPMGLRIRV